MAEENQHSRNRLTPLRTDHPRQWFFRIHLDLDQEKQEHSESYRNAISSRSPENVFKYSFTIPSNVDFDSNYELRNGAQRMAKMKRELERECSDLLAHEKKKPSEFLKCLKQKIKPVHLPILKKIGKNKLPPKVRNKLANLNESAVFADEIFEEIDDSPVDVPNTVEQLSNRMDEIHLDNVEAKMD
ncbi:uncharacterized protein LOC143909420 [Arctopsyche grandis]|uniref:uncharacterized protein LOC143909420 n=1 Tax=Arctopsyche grandis TaxID=121162 RepID=UPI00406D97FB